MATRDDVEKLKVSWLRDPNWDIEDTPGFEEFKDELLAFHKEQDEKWERAAFERKVKRGEKVGAWTGIYDIDLAEYLSTPDEIENAVSRLDGLIDSGTAVEMAQFAISREQVRATMLLTMQVKGIADLLEKQNDREVAESTVDFMTRLHKAD